MEVRNIVRHKWVVPVAALILVLSIGAGAWAATDSTDSSTQSAQDATEADCGVDEGMRGIRGHMRGPFGDRAAGEGQRDEMRANMQERLESYVDSLRSKLSAEEQQQLDTLLEQLKTKREALDRAADDMRQTVEELRDLLAPYRTNSNDAGSGTDGGASGTTATTTPSGTSTVYQ